MSFKSWNNLMSSTYFHENVILIALNDSLSLSLSLSLLFTAILYLKSYYMYSYYKCHIVTRIYKSENHIKVTKKLLYQKALCRTKPRETNSRYWTWPV